MMGSKAFESPLVSHARMRALFRGLVEARELSRAAGRGRGWPRGLEACWVATALDLKPVDLVSDEAAPWLVEHVRRLGARVGARAVSAGEFKKTRAPGESALRSVNTRDRLLCAVGQAMALQALGTGVAVAYAQADALTAAEWTSMIKVAWGDRLPLIVVSLPGAGDMAAMAARAGGTAVPVIPVDAGDPLALYRVAQETIGRARLDGGLAIIECVDLKTDPVRLLGRQLVAKGICTERWVAGVTPAVQRTLAAAQGAAPR